MKKFILFLLLIAVLTSGCKLMEFAPESKHTKKIYRKSIENAMSPAPSKVYPNLISITKQNKKLEWKKINGEDYILVVSWKEKRTPYVPYVNKKYETKEKIWVTTSPELLLKMKKIKSKNVNLRLKQLIGLPPNSTYKYFIEFWVRPKDLIRPCPDNNITTNKCGICFPKKTESKYKEWFNNYRINSYYQCNLYDNYPWTQLGYTYDWNPQNKTHVGLSEFVIKTKSEIIVKQTYTTSEYLSK
ncbi:hypothetical protein [Tenacibaculum xiamenense]|uniref:hypothetical protein n=1 Tax=Tenacibaculum xiamenense TaxID=1261553 RepID=UPI003893525F